MITQTTNLNLIPGGVLPRINVSQYDKGSRTLIFNLYNGSASFSVPVGASVTIQGTKPDNTAFQYACTFSDSTVTADLEQQMSVLAGEVTCELVITQSVEGEAVILGTCNFIINVEKSAVSDNTVISDTELPLIEQAIEAAAEAQASEEAAALSATSASDSADSAEDSAEDSEAYAVGTRGGVDVESTDPAYHNNAKYYAEQTASAIENLDVTDTAVAGSYVTAVSETDGLISVTREAADATPTESSTKMVTSGGVYAAVQAAEARDGDAYNSSTTYGPLGNTSGYPSFCISGDVLYKCITACVGVAPPNATYWEETDIATELSALNSELVHTETFGFTMPAASAGNLYITTVNISSAGFTELNSASIVTGTTNIICYIFEISTTQVKVGAYSIANTSIAIQGTLYITGKVN